MAEDGRIVARLFVDSSLDVPSIGLDAARTHYLRHVLRLEVGSRIAVFNGRDGEYAARIEGFGKGWCTLTLEAQLRQQQVEPDIWLVFAPIKRARLDFMAEKATELGVSAIWPVFTRHTIVTRVNDDRLHATCIEAAEQCERMTVPKVMPAARLDAVLAEWPPERRLVLCDETGAGGPIADVLGRIGTDGPAAILIGPEGGFARVELDALYKLPFVTPVGLGPRVLRADTAAIAALAIYQAVSNDGAKAPPPRSKPL
ncbi:MAG TPA: 16S rRNA (uracil(1498)-N(3))-methyltransferase [Alphaproteobacteria bacterium]